MKYQEMYLDLKAMEARVLQAMNACVISIADAFAFLAEIRCQQLEFLNAYFPAL